MGQFVKHWWRSQQRRQSRLGNLLANEVVRLALLLAFILAVHGLLLGFWLIVGADEGTFYLIADRWVMRVAYLIVSARFLHDLCSQRDHRG